MTINNTDKFDQDYMKMKKLPFFIYLPDVRASDDLYWGELAPRIYEHSVELAHVKIDCYNNKPERLVTNAFVPENSNKTTNNNCFQRVPIIN